MAIERARVASRDTVLPARSQRLDEELARLAVTHREPAAANLELEHAADVDAADQTHRRSGKQTELHQATAERALAADREQAHLASGSDAIEAGRHGARVSK